MSRLRRTSISTIMDDVAARRLLCAVDIRIYRIATRPLVRVDWTGSRLDSLLLPSYGSRD